MAPPVHATPQAPQLPALDLVSTQAPLQLVMPVAHLVSHLPSMHCLPVGQTLPQAPQWLGLDCRSRQSVPHISSGGEQPREAPSSPGARSTPPPASSTIGPT